MNTLKVILTLAVCALLAGGSNALAQEEDGAYILEVTTVGVKIGHEMKFREAVKAYHQCLKDREYEGSWTAWRNVGGEGIEYHFVSTMDNWAELDSPDEIGRTCWRENHEALTSHVNSVARSFARPLSDWSGDAEGFTVVRLHHFRVDDNSDFRDTVGAITDIMKEAGYAHMGSWYENIGNDSNEPDYFVVEHFDDFAAMDEDRAGPYDAVVEAAGQERADELWEQFGNSLRDDWEYATDLLRREDDLSHSNED